VRRLAAYAILRRFVRRYRAVFDFERALAAFAVGMLFSLPD
jgi:hypothetical protein